MGGLSGSPFFVGETASLTHFPTLLGRALSPREIPVQPIGTGVFGLQHCDGTASGVRYLTRDVCQVPGIEVAPPGRTRSDVAFLMEGERPSRYAAYQSAASVTRERRRSQLPMV